MVQVMLVHALIQPEPIRIPAALFQLLAATAVIGVSVLAARWLQRLQTKNREAWTIHICQNLAEAISLFASDNDGRLPAALDDVNCAGRIVWSYLPSGPSFNRRLNRLRNTFTQRWTEPSESTNAGCVRLTRGPVGLGVIGYGAGGRELVRLTCGIRVDLVSMR